MTNCLLCFQTPLAFNEYIPIDSALWLELKILEKIEKYFWTIDNMQNILGICFACWSKINDFDVFYKTVELAHNRVVMFKQDISTNCLGVEVKEINEHEVKIRFTSTGELNCKTETTLGRTELDLSTLKPVEVDGVKDETMPTLKRKRGRPRKCCLKGKSKRGRPRKYILDVKSDSGANHTAFGNDSSGIYPKIVNQGKTPPKSEPLSHSNYVHEAGTIINGSTSKAKRPRGRPRKTDCNQEITNSALPVLELSVLHTESVKENQCSTVPAEGEIHDVSKTLNRSKKLIHKKKHFLSAMKKRRRHKALMRNYIAASMRCLKILKNH